MSNVVALRSGSREFGVAPLRVECIGRLDHGCRDLALRLNRDISDDEIYRLKDVINMAFSPSTELDL